MKKFEYEGAPLVLAFVLGPLMENNLRKSLIMSQGDFSIFFTRPLAGLFDRSIVPSDFSSHPLDGQKKEGDPQRRGFIGVSLC